MLGYSRGARFKILLDKLFKPLLFGRTNARVLLKLNDIPANQFENGQELLKWMSGLNIANKAYQSAHSYFLFYKDINPRSPPPTPTIHNIELDFVRIEYGFSRSKYKNSSFFSYNWLLHKLLNIHQQHYYTQFIKPIKCHRRFKKYEDMWNHIKTLGNAVEGPDSLKTSQTPPLVSPGDDSRYHRNLSFLASRLARNHQNTIDLT
jgi:hypothetical protein